ncbi:nicotinamidase [PVC group bacterium]|nr:nicotinamidase [PVC group bacterium]
MKHKKALLIVDVQIDFCPGGALAVPDGDRVVMVLNQWIRLFQRKKNHIFASRDWHPSHSRHFKEFGGTWPCHCVQNTQGAEFHPDLNLPKDVCIISKGTHQDDEGYSALKGTDQNNHDLQSILESEDIKALYVGGLATDYCVKHSAIDAAQAGIETYVIEDAVRAVGLKEHDEREAKVGMKKAGVKFVTLKDMILL